jgi:hypothetical protein
MNSPMRDASSMKTVGSFGVVESEQAAGRLDYQLAGLIEFVWACEAAAAQADRFVAAIRWGCRESRIDKER